MQVLVDHSKYMHGKISKCYNFLFQNAPILGPTWAPNVFRVDKNLSTKDDNL